MTSGAVISSIALTENAVLTFVDEIGWSRKKARAFVGVIHADIFFCHHLDMVSVYDRRRFYLLILFWKSIDIFHFYPYNYRW